MSELLRLLVVFFAAVNPPAVVTTMLSRNSDADPRPRWQLPALGFIVSAVVYAIAVAFASDILDWLKIPPESFRVAAGITMATLGVQAITLGALPRGGEDRGIQAAVFPLALPLLAGPAGLAAALSYGADQGFGKPFAAAIVATALTAGLLCARPERGKPALDALARLTGALLIAVAAGLIISGVRDI